ncbi:hypothetical protein ACLOJK_031028 [Asimina triloba]
MAVTRSNFESSLEDLRHHVRAADFVSFDIEMTGVTSAPWRESLEFDRSDIRYLKVKDSAEKFAIVQFGVCPFRWDGQNESFIAHPHNFYIFPRKELAVDGPSYEFLCQATSIDFLAKHQFDFNACIHEGTQKENVITVKVSQGLLVSNRACDEIYTVLVMTGISYLSREQEEEALHALGLRCGDELVNSQRLLKDVEIPLVSTFDILFTERMKSRFRDWRDALLQNTNRGSQFEENSDSSSPHLQTVFFKMRPALKLNGFTSHQLRLIQLSPFFFAFDVTEYIGRTHKLFCLDFFPRHLSPQVFTQTSDESETVQIIRKHFEDLAYVRVAVENSCEQKLVVYTDTEDDRVLLMKEVKEHFHKEAEGKVKVAVGFRHVIDLLASEQKLIVGHNCFLDLAHIQSKFFGSLPPSVEEFAASIHRSFPYVIDTKLLLKASPIIQRMMKKNSTSLSSAFATLCPQIAYGSKSHGLVALASYKSAKVEVQVDDMRSSYWNSGAKHEAGYDAFMTGCIFAQACSLLGIDFEQHSPSLGLSKNEKLQKYINLLYLCWNGGSMVNLSTGTEIPEVGAQNYKNRYPKIVFENTVLVWGFQSNVKPRELRECICKVFGLDSVRSVYYLDKTAAFIQFSKEEFASKFLNLRNSLGRRNDLISVLHPLTKLFEGGHTDAGGYDIYKQICISPISKLLFADQAEAVGIRRNFDVEIEAPENMGTSCLGNVSSEHSNWDSARKKDELVVDKGGKVSCEQVLDSLYLMEPSRMKWTRTT